MIKLFIKKTILFVGILLPVLAITLFCWFKYYDIPGPNLSNSPSLNEKIHFIKKNTKRSALDILAIGSSMSLNNLHSKTIINKLNSNLYLNTSTWGQNMEETFTLLKIYEKIYKPKNLLISSNFMDFKKGDKIFRYDFIEDYLNHEKKPEIFFYLKSFSLQYLINSSKELNKYKNKNKDYQFLGFDKFGGVSFSNENFNIHSGRWNGVVLTKYKIEPIQYQYLDSISKFCKSKNINLYFAQSPLRNGFLNKLDIDEISFLNSHLEKIELILAKNKHNLINANNRNWPDSLFVDFNHLNEHGAKLYTEYYLENIEGNEDFNGFK